MESICFLHSTFNIKIEIDLFGSVRFLKNGIRVASVNTPILVRVTGSWTILGRGAGTVMVDRGGVEKDGITVLSWQVWYYLLHVMICHDMTCYDMVCYNMIYYDMV